MKFWLCGAISTVVSADYLYYRPLWQSESEKAWFPELKRRGSLIAFPFISFLFGVAVFGNKSN